MSVDHAPQKTGRRRPRANKKSRGGASITDAIAAASTHDNTIIPEIQAPIPTPEPLSFATKIGLALQGSNWQELQNGSSSTVTMPTEAPAEETVVPDNNIQEPRQPTAKQLKKLERLGATIVRDTGDVLQTIEVDSITPVEEDVIWDEDPELICSYNWKASTDSTNTIFGKSLGFYCVRGCLCPKHLLPLCTDKINLSSSHIGGIPKKTKEIQRLTSPSPRRAPKMAAPNHPPHPRSR
jgi:hypothetical protein